MSPTVLRLTVNAIVVFLATYSIRVERSRRPYELAIARGGAPTCRAETPDGRPTARGSVATAFRNGCST